MDTEIVIPVCALEMCNSKCINETKYCMKHQINVFLDETKALNKRPCKNYIRKCRSQLDESYTKKMCENCLEKGRIKDKQRRGLAVDTTITENNTKLCSKCNTEKEMTCFQGEKGGVTKTCDECRSQNKKQDGKRDKDHRNAVARVAEQKPARKAVKKAWAEDNHDKVALKTMNYRQRQIENDIDGYHKRQADNAKRWRENNPERNTEIKMKIYDSTSGQYNIYKRSADQRNIEFGLSFPLYESIVSSPCVYCNEVQERGFNGIDRVDSAVGYVQSNCHSCCQMCNYMKGCCGVDYFLKKIEHILTFQGKIDGNLCYDIMPNTKGCSYKQYEQGAISRGKSFEISQELFENIRIQECYLCGKQNSAQHKNGIDRVDNSKGYIEGNIMSCCWDCNGMKRDYTFDDLLAKMAKICENKKDEEDEKDEKHDNIVQNIVMNNIRQITNTKKKTKEEIREAAKLRKQKQREKLRKKYGDEEYKKIRAKELSDFRKSNK